MRQYGRTHKPREVSNMEPVVVTVLKPQVKKAPKKVGCKAKFGKVGRSEVFGWKNFS